MRVVLIIKFNWFITIQSYDQKSECWRDLPRNVYP